MPVGPTDLPPSRPRPGTNDPKPQPKPKPKGLMIPADVYYEVCAGPVPSGDDVVCVELHTGGVVDLPDKWFDDGPDAAA
jgi:hypothetical protein